MSRIPTSHLPQSVVSTADNLKINTPIIKQGEIFIVFDDSGSMGESIANAQKAVISFLVNTASTSKASEVPFVHFFPLNSKSKKNVAYPFQNLIDYLREGHPRSEGGTPFAKKVNETSSYINERIDSLVKENKRLSTAIVYIFTDGKPEGGGGQSWLNSVDNLRKKANNDLVLDVQLTVLGKAMPKGLYSQFFDLQAQKVKFSNLVINRTESIEEIEVDAQALVERLLIQRINSRLEAIKNLVSRAAVLSTVRMKLDSLKEELDNLEADQSTQSVQEILAQAIKKFKSDKNQQNIEFIASEFQKITAQSKNLQDLKERTAELNANILNLHQLLNEGRGDLSDISQTISNMTPEQKQKQTYSDLISTFQTVNSSFENIGRTDFDLVLAIEDIQRRVASQFSEVEKGYSHILSNSDLLVEFLASLPGDIRRKIEQDLSVAEDIAVDYQNKTIIYTGVHFFGGSNDGTTGSSHQTDWKVVNRGTMVNLGGQSTSAVADEFVNEGVILHGGHQSDRGTGYTHLVNNGRIIRLSQKIRGPKKEDPSSNFHWQRVDESDKTRFVIYDEADGSIYQVTWDFILNFKRGTTRGGKIYNFFARLVNEKKVMNEFHTQVDNIDSLKGQDAKEFLQGMYPERLKVLRRSEDEWLALVPESLMPAFEDIICIEMNGDLGYGKAALTDESLKRDLEYKRKRQCGR